MVSFKLAWQGKDARSRGEGQQWQPYTEVPGVTVWSLVMRLLECQKSDQLLTGLPLTYKLLSPSCLLIWGYHLSNRFCQFPFISLTRLLLQNMVVFLCWEWYLWMSNIFIFMQFRNPKNVIPPVMSGYRNLSSPSISNWIVNMTLLEGCLAVTDLEKARHLGPGWGNLFD